MDEGALRIVVQERDAVEAAFEEALLACPVGLAAVGAIRRGDDPAAGVALYGREVLILAYDTVLACTLPDFEAAPY